MLLRKTAFPWLLTKELRELLASKAWWFFLLSMGPLVGVSFIGSIHAYAEASGLHGTALGVGEAFSPLIGIWAPTFSACELSAVFLLPFVAIRVVAGDTQSGALKLELQHRMSSMVRIIAKALVLFLGWIIASLAPLTAVLLWKSYGGSIYLPELGAVVLGHLLNAGFIIALAAAAAVMTSHPSTAAIVTLLITIGGWIIAFIAAVHGGVWGRAAGYTPAAMVAEFQHGLVRLDAILIAIYLMVFGLALAAIWRGIGSPVRQRIYKSIALSGVIGIVMVLSANVNTSWDLSENRMNSFSRADEQALRQIHQVLHIEVHLAPEDPRRIDFERRALSKLRRVLSNVDIRYESSTSIGLFEQSNPNYGEISYELGGKKAVSHATTVEGLLDMVYSLSGITPPEQSEEEIFRGHPLRATPTGASVLFYVVWPLLVAVIGWFVLRRPL